MIVLRKTVLEDIPKMYENLNLKYVKKYCKGQEEKQWEIHRIWYMFLINSPSYLLYTVEDTTGKFIGNIKFEIQDEIAIFSIYLVEEVRGRGYSKILIDASIEELKFENSRISLILAYILEENENSIKAFEKADFICDGVEEYNGIDHLLYIKVVNRDN